LFSDKDYAGVQFFDGDGLVGLGSVASPPRKVPFRNARCVCMHAMMHACMRRWGGAAMTASCAHTLECSVVV
jgi:hypothetical protein